MKPILRNFPTTIETERLILRAPEPGDGSALNEAILDSLEALRPWLRFARTAPTVEESEEHIRQSRANFLRRTSFNCLIWLKEEPLVIGRTGLNNIDWDIPAFEIGYWLRSTHTGYGYMTEAVAALTDFAFDELDARRVAIYCNVKNERSAAVARRLGYTHEATILCDGRDHFGELRDTLAFAKFREDPAS